MNTRTRARTSEAHTRSEQCGASERAKVQRCEGELRARQARAVGGGSLGHRDLGLLADELDDVDGLGELLGLGVRDLEAELGLHGHHELHLVQRVEPEVVDEVRLRATVYTLTYGV